MSSTTVTVKENLIFDGSAESFIQTLIAEAFDSIQLVNLVANIPDPEIGGETEYSATIIGIKTIIE